jgi:hypothetical protein
MMYIQHIKVWGRLLETAPTPTPPPGRVYGRILGFIVTKIKYPVPLTQLSKSNHGSQNIKTQLTTQRTGGYSPGSFVNPASGLF